ncbi:MAG: carboxypeptidase regulatory-like domain-containing protein [Bacteroidetes bacterium]|nr:carboxypeptidase regulatory-like domain-containing protein [Bacteroidota bacterium]
MNDHQENFRTMCLTTQQICINHQTDWQSNTVFTNNFNAFGVLIGNLNTARQQQEQKSTGTTKDKNTKRKTLVDIAITHISAIKSYAADNNNNQLYELVNYTKSALLHARDTLLIDKTTIVRDAANNNLANLANYGITSATIAALTQAISDFNAIISAPRTARTETKTATSDIETIIEQLHTQLKRKLDNNIETFKTSHHDFYTAYHNARKIIDTAGKTGVKGTVTDKLTTAALGGALVSLKGVLASGFRARTTAPPDDTRTTRTNRSGHYSFKRIPEGNYQLEITKAGYKTNTTQVSVRTSSMTDADIQMEKP